jgi:hemolysin activation/secretion protein
MKPSRRSPWVSLLPAVVLLTGIAGPAAAAEPTFGTEPSFGLEPSFDPQQPFGRDPLGDAPDTDRSPAPDVRPVLPPLDLPPGVDSPAGTRFTLASVVLRGSTVLTGDDVAAVVRPYLNRQIGPADLQALRRQLTLLYVQRGHVNSGVLLPDQVVRDGEVILVAVEGELSDVVLESEGAIDEDFVTRAFRNEVQVPLAIQDLENGIRRLELNPLIRRVEARLLPGDGAGQGRLGVRLDEAPPIRVVAGFDNHTAPSIGSTGPSLSVQHLDFTGNRDTLWASVSATGGSRDGYLVYRLPVWDDRVELGAYYERASTEVVERPFDDLDIEGDAENFGVSVDYRLVDRLGRRLSILSGVDYASSETQLLGEPFSFSLGARNGESTSTSVRVGLEWIERWHDRLLAVRTSVRRGVDWLDSTVIPSGAPKEQLDTGAEIPDSRFTVILTQAQWASRVGFLNSQLVVNAAWQEALDPLLSVDKFALGGSDTVRGFRENALLRDSGLYANVEWRVPVFRDDPAWSAWQWTLVPFVDYGRAWDEDDRLTTSDPSTLSSIGLGVTATPFEGGYMELFYGHRLSDDDYVAGEEHDLQDDGLHFAFNYRWLFD